eukprot:scaffold204225_cov30-Tisochrysis_lutea.AAC.2
MDPHAGVSSHSRNASHTLFGKLPSEPPLHAPSPATSSPPLWHVVVRASLACPSPRSRQPATQPLSACAAHPRIALNRSPAKRRCSSAPRLRLF